MKILVIGATGYVGSHVARRLIEGGHEVVGLTRSSRGAEFVRSITAEPVIGSTADMAHLGELAKTVDATIFAAQSDTQDDEAIAVQALLSALKGSGKTFLMTSGTAVFAERTDGEWGDAIFSEYDAFTPLKYIVRRAQTEMRVTAAAQDGVRGMVIRPPAIWGSGYCGIVDRVISSIEATGKACYIGSGRNSTSQVNVLDLVDLYLLILEHGTAGAVYHATSGELSARSIADYVAQQQGVTSASVTLKEAFELWDTYTVLIAMGGSNRSTSPRARLELGWKPTRLDLVERILAGSLNGGKWSR